MSDRSWLCWAQQLTRVSGCPAAWSTTPPSSWALLPQLLIPHSPWLLVHPPTLLLVQVWGNLGAFLERLDDEWNGSLKVGRGLTARVGLCTKSTCKGCPCAAAKAASTARPRLASRQQSKLTVYMLLVSTHPPTHPPFRLYRRRWTPTPTSTWTASRMRPCCWPWHRRWVGPPLPQDLQPHHHYACSASDPGLPAHPCLPACLAGLRTVSHTQYMPTASTLSCPPAGV